MQVSKVEMDDVVVGDEELHPYVIEFVDNTGAYEIQELLSERADKKKVCQQLLSKLLRQCAALNRYIDAKEQE